MAGQLREFHGDDLGSALERGVTLVDFWAPWCGPCRMQGPILETVAADLAGRATIGKLNIDEHAELAAEHGVQSIPTLILFRDGAEVERFVGVQQADTLRQAVEEALSASPAPARAGGHACGGCGGCGR